MLLKSLSVVRVIKPNGWLILMWVLGQQVGLDGVSGFLACLLSLALLIWALTLNGKVGRMLSALAWVILALSIWHWAPMWTQVQPQANTSDGTPTNQIGQWEAWSREKVAMAEKEGRPVFVDFTAAWCVTCQYNKKTPLAHAPLLADFAARKVVLLRADWTRRDPAITQALTDLGRSGVPVYALYSPDRAVVLFSELPSVAEVQAALQKLPQ